MMYYEDEGADKDAPGLPAAPAPLKAASAPADANVVQFPSVQTNPAAHIDREAALAFFRTLYGEPRGQTITFRAVPEPRDGRSPTNDHLRYDEHFAEALDLYLCGCASEVRAAFFLPGVVKPGGTGKADVIELPAIVIDFDKGDPAASLAAAEAELGPAHIVVESGGTVDGKPKLHAYWRVDDPTRVAEICAMREDLAKRFGGDPAFKQAAQVIRIPGSLHMKSGRKQVRLRDVREDAPVVTVARPPGGTSTVSQGVDFDFSKDVSSSDSTARALLEQTHEGGVDGITRFEAAGKVIGHFLNMVREGRYDLDAAWEHTKNWNAAKLSPPWSEERLRGDFDRIVARDAKEKGPFVPPAAAVQATPGVQITDWYSHKRFKGEAPVRQWIVDGLIAAGTAGVFAAVGDAGKSMMALNLARMVANYPEPGLLNIGTPDFFGCPVTARGTAIFITGEDDEAEIHRRLNALEAPGDDGLRSHERNSSRLITIPLISAGGAKAIIRNGPNGPELTPYWHDLRAQIEAHPDVKFIGIDPLSLFVAGDENDNTLAAVFMVEMNSLAAKTGAAVMVVHHFAKGKDPSGLGDARSAIRGASAYVNNSRFALALWEADEDGAFKALEAIGDKDPMRVTRQAGLVYFGGLVKSNAPASKEIRTFVRGENGLLMDKTAQIRAAARQVPNADAAIHAELMERKRADPQFTFTPSASALWPIMEPAIREHRLPVTKDGKKSGHESVTTVFNRLCKAGLVVQTQAPGRFEPVEKAA